MHIIAAIVFVGAIASMGFVWNTADMLQGMTEEEFETNSRTLLEAWTQFARDGYFKGGKII